MKDVDHALPYSLPPEGLTNWSGLHECGGHTMEGFDGNTEFLPGIIDHWSCIIPSKKPERAVSGCNNA